MNQVLQPISDHRLFASKQGTTIASSLLKTGFRRSRKLADRILAKKPHIWLHAGTIKHNNIIQNQLSAFHAGRPNWHSRYRKSDCFRTLFQQPFNRNRRHMPLNYVTRDLSSVAPCNMGWHAQACAYRRHVVRFFDRNSITSLPHMLSPAATANAVWVSVHDHGLICLCTHWEHRQSRCPKANQQSPTRQ